MLNVIMLNVIMLNVIMLNVIILNVIMLNVIMLIATMLNVVESFCEYLFRNQCCKTLYGCNLRLDKIS
jgi:hypothetical protein